MLADERAASALLSRPDDEPGRRAARSATSVVGQQRTGTTGAAHGAGAAAPAAGPADAAAGAGTYPTQRPWRSRSAAAAGPAVFGMMLVLLLLAAGGAAAVIATSNSNRRSSWPRGLRRRPAGRRRGLSSRSSRTTRT